MISMLVGNHSKTCVTITQFKNMRITMILTIMAHHSEKGEETGGAIFEALKKTVPTYTVRNGVVSQKPSKSGECVLVVHGAPRGLNVHAKLLTDFDSGSVTLCRARLSSWSPLPWV